MLVLVPIVLAHKLLDIRYVIPALVGLLAFCLSASAVYLVNDLLDMPADRRHRTKRYRSIAAGTLSVPARSFITALLDLDRRDTLPGLAIDVCWHTHFLPHAYRVAIPSF